MSFRNLDPQRMFESLALEHKPKHAFQGTAKNDFVKWKSVVLPEVMATLGKVPERVRLNPQILAEWEHDGLFKQRWLIDVGKHISATFLVNFPSGLLNDEKRPAIFCWHGHGKFGKETVMGNNSSPELSAEMALYNYGYGHEMAKTGFITYAIDWMGIGERNPSSKPNWRINEGIHDWCDAFYLHATMLGTTVIAMNVAQGSAATDFACSLPNVDPDRLGVMGLSGGGTMTLWTALCDQRFKAAEIICYSDLWAHFGMRDVNYCGMQVAPGLFGLVDLPDLQGLLAPMPLLIDIGAYDTCFRVDTAMACFRQLQSIYAAAGAADLLELDIFAGEHAWGGNKSKSFFSKCLGLNLSSRADADRKTKG